MGITLSLALFLSRFIAYDDGTADAPGKIKIIGDAGSPNVFVFRKWAIDEVKVPGEDLEKVKISLTIQPGSLEKQ